MGLLMLAATALALTCPQQLPAEYADDEESSETVILVLKAEHLLGVYRNDELVAGTCVPAKFGSRLHRATRAVPAWWEQMATDGPKLRRGDSRTPEGWYEISVRNPESSYYLSLGINYPNFDDVMRGRENGVIDHDTSNALVDVINYNDDVRTGKVKGKKKIVPQNTALGGDIFIHGNPNGYTNDWTLGCVSVSNAAMYWLFHRYGELGTAVLILSSLDEPKSAEP